MKFGKLLLWGGIAAAAIYLFSNPSNSAVKPSAAAAAAVAKPPVKVYENPAANITPKEALKSSQVTKTPSTTPSKTVIPTTSYIKATTGISTVRNTMGVTASVASALRGTISPLTGKLRV